MSLFWKKITDLRSDAAIKELNDFLSKAAKMINQMQLPVGSLYWNDKDPTNPAILLGYGTWERITERFIYAATDSGTYAAGKTGGAETVSIAQTNLPNILFPLYTRSGYGITAGTGTDNTMLKSQVAASTGEGNGGNNQLVARSEGGNVPINKMPPFEAAYCWKRTG